MGATLRAPPDAMPSPSSLPIGAADCSNGFYTDTLRVDSREAWWSVDDHPGNNKFKLRGYHCRPISDNSTFLIVSP
jgi:hypothetical protein